MMSAQVDHSFEKLARVPASRTDRYVDDLSAMLEPDKETAALERLAAMSAREFVVVWVLSELHSDFHSHASVTPPVPSSGGRRF